VEDSSTFLDGKIVWRSVLCWDKCGGKSGSFTISHLTDCLFEQSGPSYPIRYILKDGKILPEHWMFSIGKVRKSDLLFV